MQGGSNALGLVVAAVKSTWDFEVKSFQFHVAIKI